MSFIHTLPSILSKTPDRSDLHSYQIMTTFAQHLRSVVFAADSLTDNQYQKIIRSCISYADTLGFDRVDLLLITRFEGEDAVKYEIESNQHGCMPFFLLKDQKPNGLCPLASVRERPIWVIGNDDGLSIYRPNPELVDLWSGIQEIPEPKGYEDSAFVRTEVVIPIRSIRRVIGVVSFRSKDRITPNSYIKDELSRLSEILNQAYITHKESVSRSISTSEAIENISNAPGNIRVMRSGRANVFVAFPAKANVDVIKIIRSELDKSDRLNPIYWDQNFSSGSITERIVSDILRSDIGIAYFSEPNGNGDGYSDNSNVLFEAGLFEGCHRLGGLGPFAWVPIRESASDRFPFDIAGLNTVIVHRNDDGELSSSFSDDLSARLNYILTELGL